MKNFFKIALAFLLCFTLCGCGNSHKELIELVNNKEYDKAIEYINNLAYEDAANKGTIDKKGLTEVLIDEWVLFDNAEEKDIQKITFKDDYTVYLDDQKYIWEINSEGDNYLSAYILDGATKVGSVNINSDNSYSLSYSIYDSEQDIFHKSRNFFNDADYNKIELTTDNWDTYFEITDYHHFSKDAFDEINSFSLYQILKLKDEYYGKLLNANYKIAYELSYDECEWAIDIDYPNQTATLKDKIKKTYTTTREGTFIDTSVYEEKYFGTYFFTSSESIDYYDKKISRCDNVNIDRIQGHFYLHK